MKRKINTLKITCSSGRLFHQFENYPNPRERKISRNVFFLFYSHFFFFSKFVIINCPVDGNLNFLRKRIHWKQKRIFELYIKLLNSYLYREFFFFGEGNRGL